VKFFLMGWKARWTVAGLRREVRSVRWKPLFFIESAGAASSIGLVRALAYLLSIVRDGKGGVGEGVERWMWKESYKLRSGRKASKARQALAAALCRISAYTGTSATTPQQLSTSPLPSNWA
jgi:hypothetical protein